MERKTLKKPPENSRGGLNPVAVGCCRRFFDCKQHVLIIALKLSRSRVIVKNTGDAITWNIAALHAASESP